MAKKRQYVSEKEIIVGNKPMWLVKTDDHITVQDGEKEVFNGSANAFQRWIKKQ